MLRTLALAAVLLAVALHGARAQGDGDYPNRPVRLVAAAAPGGNPDVLARLLSQKLSGVFGKAFVVENVPGAGGVVAAKLVAAAPPDGHVLMLGDSGAMAINVVLNPDLGYDPLRDFTPITALVTVPTVLVVHPSVPATTLQEFIALAKSKPGQLAYGSAGPGSIHHLTMAIFAAQTGIDLLHVPYRGGTALVGGLIKGEVQAGFDYATMMGLQTSAGAARNLVARLQAVVAKALREPDMVDRMAALGMDLRENGTADYVKFMKDDIERYRTAIKTFKLQIN